MLSTLCALPSCRAWFQPRQERFLFTTATTAFDCSRWGGEEYGGGKVANCIERHITQAPDTVSPGERDSLWELAKARDTKESAPHAPDSRRQIFTIEFG